MTVNTWRGMHTREPRVSNKSIIKTQWSTEGYRRLLSAGRLLNAHVPVCICVLAWQRLYVVCCEPFLLCLISADLRHSSVKERMDSPLPTPFTHKHAHTALQSSFFLVFSPLSFLISLLILLPRTDNGALENTGLCWIIQISSGSKPESKGERRRAAKKKWEYLGWWGWWRVVGEKQTETEECSRGETRCLCMQIASCSSAPPPPILYESPPCPSLLH